MNFKSMTGLILVFVLSACSSTAPQTPGPQPTTPPQPADCNLEGEARLTVEITGLPEGLAGLVTLNGEDFLETLTGTQRFDAFNAGHYTLSARRVTDTHEIIRTVYDPVVETESFCIEAEEVKTVTIEYSAIPSSGKLWLSGNSGVSKKFRALQADFLVSTGTALPVSVATTSPIINAPTAVAYDKDGNLWMIDSAGSLNRYPAEQLGDSGEKVADIVIAGPALSGIPGPRNMAFDKDGNIWVSVSAGNKIVKFSAEQLTLSGSPAPVLELLAPADVLSLAFDLQGNLWAAIKDAGKVIRYNAADLSAGSGIVPALILESFETTMRSPLGLAFDTKGNLWISYMASNIIARLDASQLKGEGAIELLPDTRITLPVSAILSDIAFDERGYLWTAYKNGQIAGLSQAQLKYSGSKTPEIIVTSSSSELMGYAKGLSTYPAPAGLPLYHSLP